MPRISGGISTSKTFVPYTDSPKRLQQVREFLVRIVEINGSHFVVFQSLPNDSNDTLENSVGYISDHTEVKVIDGNGKVVPFGQPGELCVRGYMTLMDYYDDAEKTKEVLGADRWFRTGDQFVLQASGYANIVGRLKEMIIRGGENLYPREIEDFLNTHPDIKETHVIGRLRIDRSEI